MRIAILETGVPPKPLSEQFPHYPAMMREMLAPTAPQFSFLSVPVFDGAAPPAMGEFDGAVITGSPAGVYEGHIWIKPLETFIRQAAAARKPQVGICFGHQIMARAFGGEVKKSDKGWGVGVHRYDVHEPAPWMDPAQSRITCAVSHQDQVLSPPDGARVLGGSSFCPNGVLSYAEGPAISFQMHPEFSHEFAQALLALRRERIGEDVAAPAFQSLRGKSDRKVIARWIANFFLMEA